jgi:hypothetical protein
MAEVPYTIAKTKNPFVWVVSWLALDKDDTGTAFDVSSVPGAGGADRSVQILGTFGTSTGKLQGSNDGGTTWVSLADPQGNVIEKTSAALEAVLEYTRAVRPTVTGGTTAAIDFYLVVKGSR